MARGVAADRQEIVQDYAAGNSIPSVAKKHGVSRSTVRLAVLRAGVLRGRAEGVRLAAEEGRLGSGMRGAVRNFTPEHVEAIRTAAIDRGERTAKGHSLKPNGYVSITRGTHKGRSQHQVVAEQMIGRSLSPDEVVHHKDGNRANNDPSNLEVMTRSEHTSHHRKEKH